MGGYVATAILLASKKRMPFLLYMACCYGGGFAAKKAWQVAEDVHQVAVIQKAAMDQLVPPADPGPEVCEKP
jgi:hypothetical protein